MVKATEWGTLVTRMDALTRVAPEKKNEARLVVQQRTKSTFLFGGPNEHFSTALRSRIRQGKGDDLPIDDLYGSYSTRTRDIEIYTERIRQDHDKFGCSAQALTYIVRLHEYAHALTHLGTRFEAVEIILSEIGSDQRTDTRRILRERTRRVRALPDTATELLAQAITWMVVVSEPSLQTAFESLEQRQPAEYKLSDRVKACASSADWPLVLEAARGEAMQLPRKAKRREALESLICAAAA